MRKPAPTDKIQKRPPPMLREWEPVGDGRLDSQAAAGALMMKLAVHRPVAREAWRDAMNDYQQSAEQAAAQERLARRRVEHKLINSTIRRERRPVEPVWRPAPQSQVVSSFGRNEADERAKLAAEKAAEAKALSEAAERELAEKEAAAKAALTAAQTADREWWSAYLERKAEVDAQRAKEEEAARRKEAERWRW